MSKYHEHVTWQTQDGKWSIGFYRSYLTSSTEDDVDFDLNAFQFASSGHATPEDAERSWRGPNPGYSYHLPYSDDDPAINQLNKMCAEYHQKQKDIKQARASRPVRW